MFNNEILTVEEKNQDYRPCSRKKCKSPIDLTKLESHIRIYAFGKDYAFCSWVCIINWWKEERGG